jgi:N4-gp56 family major capsid protein
MANTQSNSNLRRQIWSKDLMVDVMRDVENGLQFAGADANNVVQIKDDLKKEKGQSVIFGMVARLSGDGVDGDNELEGNEESMSAYDESVSIDQKRNAVRLKGKLDDQKSMYDQIKPAKDNLRIWMKEFIIRQVFLKLGGVTNAGLVDTNGVVYSASCAWSNTPDYIPDADEAAGIGARYICANAGGTDALAASDKMTLDLVTKAATIAKLANPQIQPLEADGEKFYVMYLHPLQARDIRLSSDWKTANQNARERSEKNPVFRARSGLLVQRAAAGERVRAVAEHGGLGQQLPRRRGRHGLRGHDAARALLCGRQAAGLAEVNNPDALVVETFDYQNKDGVAASFLGGIQKLMFNNKEFGVVAVDSAAAL